MTSQGAKKEQVNPQDGIAFLVNPDDDGNEVKAFAFMDGQVWKAYPNCISGESAKCLQLAFFLTAKAHVLTYEAQVRGGHWPKPAPKSAPTKLLLFDRDDPDYKLWKGIGENWRQVASNLNNQYRMTELPTDFKRALKSRFQKYGESDSSAHKPVVVLARTLSPQTFLIASSFHYNSLAGRHPHSVFKNGQALSTENLRQSMLAPDAVERILQRMLFSRYAREHHGEWWLEYLRAVLSITLNHSISLETHVAPNPSYQEVDNPDRLGPSLSLARLAVAQKRFVLIGPSGAGKSWLLRQTAKEWVKLCPPSSDCLPIVLKLTDFNLIQDVSGLITETICEHIGENHRDAVKQWLHSKEGKSANVLFLLDGYNELLSPNRQRFDRRLRSFLTTRSNRVIVSSHEYDSGRICFDWMRVIVDELRSDKIRSHLISRFGNRGGVLCTQICASAELASLAKTPFYLDAIATYFENGGLKDIPSSRVGLIAAIIEGAQIRKQRECAAVSTSVFFSEVEEFLSAVAHEMLLLHSRRPLFHPQDTRRLWSNKSVPVQEILEFAELLGILSSSGAVVRTEIENAEVRFAHDLFRDYYAARFLFHSFLDDQEIFLAAIKNLYLNDMVWDEPFLMLADICKSETLAMRVVDLLSQHDVFLGAEFVARLTDVTPELLIKTIELNGSCYANGEDLQRQYKLSVSLLAKLPESTLQYLYRKMPMDTDAWTSVVYALAKKGGNSWRSLLPLREDCKKPPECILRALARVPSKDALREVVLLIRTTLTPMTLKTRLDYNRFFLNVKALLQTDQLLECLEDSANADVVDIFSGLLENAEIEDEHIQRLEELAQSSISTVCEDCIHAIARANPVRAVPFVHPDFLKSHSLSIVDVQEVFSAIIRSGEREKQLAGSIVEQLFVENTPHDVVALDCFLELFGEIATDATGDILISYLVGFNGNADYFIPVDWILPFRGNLYIVEHLKTCAKSSSPIVRARAQIMLAALGEIPPSKLLEIKSKDFSENNGEFLPYYTSVMLSQALEHLKPRNLTERIWNMAKDSDSYIFTTTAAEILSDIGYLPVLKLLCDTDHSSSYEYAARLMANKDREKCREILIALKEDADTAERTANFSRPIHLTYIAQAILRKRAWRFVSDLDGWPFGVRALEKIPLSFDIRKLKELVIEELSL